MKKTIFCVKSVIRMGLKRFLGEGGDLRLGCSGWSYSDWVGPFYEREIGMLAQYTKVFRTVEIDSTFYSLPPPRLVEGWARRTPADFVFTAKLPRQITHKRLLKGGDPSTELQQFLKLMEPLRLRGKLGPLLVQLPPGFDYTKVGALEDLLNLLPKGWQFAVEFRHPSWLEHDEVWQLLERYGVAYTIVDEPLLPPLVKVTTSKFTYVRWHGHGERPWYNYFYREEELKPWVPRIQQLLKEVDVVYGFFNNHFHAYAVANCLQMLKFLGYITPQQERVLAKVLEHLATKPRIRPTLAEAKGAEPFDVLVARNDVEGMLAYFMDEKRLRRAKEIPDKEVVVEEADETGIHARIRTYTIIIDLENREILHDCADWSRVSAAGQFCKHVGKLFLSIPVQQAIAILTDLYHQRDSWLLRPLIGEEA